MIPALQPRLAALLLATAAIALAQISPLVPLAPGGAQLAITDDGSVVYFASGLRLKDAPPDNSRFLTNFRVYRGGPDGVSLFAERGVLASPNSGSSSSGAVAPQLSGDGAVVGVTLNDVCFDDACNIITSVGELRGASSTRVGQGTLQLSRNGRWALLLEPSGGGSSNGAVPPKFVPTLVDLQTGERTTVPPSPYAALRAVASDGSVLVTNPGWAIWKRGKTTPLAIPSGFAYGHFALSDDAGALFATRLNVAPSLADVKPQLVAIDVATGAPTVLYEGSTSLQMPLFLSASTNGRRVLYRVQDNAFTGPAFLADTSTSVSTPILLPDGDLVADGALTGSGEIAALAAVSGKLYKLYAASGVLETVVPATPACFAPNQIAPGSLVHLQCAGFDPAADLSGRILIGGRPVPILSANSLKSVAIQVPWESPTGSADLDVTVPSASPFDSKQRTYVSRTAPAFEPLAGDQPRLLPIALFKVDWSGPVTAPPAPGDIMHLYMTGLGAVKKPIQTGAPASLTDINPTVAAVACQFLPGNTPLTTLFSGLAPGMIGIYQVTVQAPADRPAGPVKGLSCSAGSASIQISVL